MGFEPTTYSLRKRYSTPELHRHVSASYRATQTTACRLFRTIAAPPLQPKLKILSEGKRNDAVLAKKIYNFLGKEQPRNVRVIGVSQVT